MTTRQRTHRATNGYRPLWRVLVTVSRLIRGTLALVALLALMLGLPWALAHFVGWPLPDHVPTWDEAEMVLLSPMSARLLLDVLGSMCWVVWLFFAVDVLRCTAEAVRGITWPRARSTGPLQGLAAALIGTIVLTVLGNRTPSSPPTSALVLSDGLVPVAVSAPFRPGPVLPETPVRYNTMTIDSEAPAPPGMVQVTEEIRVQENGVYDSLWRVAERIHHDGTRWPELFEQNRDRVQPDGRVLIHPDRVRPGWKITAYIPAPAPSTGRQPDDKGSPDSPQPPTTTPTAPSIAPSGTHAQADHTDRRDPSPEPGVDLATGAFVSLALATMISGAVVSVRMRRRRQYRIGSSDRTDLERPIAPIVRALRTAHELNTPLDDLHVVEVVPTPPSAPPHGPVAVVARVGLRSGRELALNLATTHGLGLLGPGATAAARAVLLHLLAEQVQPEVGVRVLVPAADLDLVFDGEAAEVLPSTVVVVDSLDTALDEMEAALLTRTRHQIEETTSQLGQPVVVLLGSPAAHAERRLQAILDNGSVLGLAGILIGQWRPGATLRVRADGSVGAASPGLGGDLMGSRLFTLPATDTAELLKVLREAEGSTDIPSAAASRPGEPVAAAVESQPAQHVERAQLVEPDANGSDPVLHLRLPEEVQLCSEIAKKPAVAGGSDSDRPWRPLVLQVLGRVGLVLNDEGTEHDLGGALTPKQREVLVYLALHPKGARREALNDAVWPDSRPPRPFNSMHNALSLLRRALSQATDGQISDLVLHDNGRYLLNTKLVTTDYEGLRQALNTQRPSSSGDALDLLRDAVELYQGDLAEDLTSPRTSPRSGSSHYGKACDGTYSTHSAYSSAPMMRPIRTPR
jgi:hypothetical protein